MKQSQTPSCYHRDTFSDASEPSLPASALEVLLLQLQHDIGDLNVLFCLVLGGDLEDDVLLVPGNGLLADGLDECGHPESTC